METRLRDMRYSDTLKFKSYYVVWKLQSFNITEKEKIGLNRTMQYGNIYIYVYIRYNEIV